MARIFFSKHFEASCSFVKEDAPGVKTSELKFSSVLFFAVFLPVTKMLISLLLKCVLSHSSLHSLLYFEDDFEDDISFDYGCHLGCRQEEKVTCHMYWPTAKGRGIKSVNVCRGAITQQDPSYKQNHCFLAHVEMHLCVVTSNLTCTLPCSTPLQQYVLVRTLAAFVGIMTEAKRQRKLRGEA